MWNQPSTIAVGRRLGLVPVALHHHVAAGEHLAAGVDRHLAAERRSAGAVEHHRPIGGRQLVELGAGAVHREQRCGLGEPVDLDELPAELGLAALDRARRRRRSGDRRSGSSRRPGSDPPSRSPASRTMLSTAGAPHISVTPCCVDAAQDLGAVDLAQDHVLAAHPGDRVQHPPAVAVELGERVQIRVAIADAHLPPEHGGVEPDVAVGELNALGARRRAGRVVDRGRRVLVALPRLAVRRRSASAPRRSRRRSTIVRSHSTPASASASSGSTSRSRAPECSTMYLTSSATRRKLIGTRIRPGPRDTEQRRRADAPSCATPSPPVRPAAIPSCVEAGRDRPCPLGHVAVRDRTPRLGGLVRLVDDGRAVGVEQLGPAEEVVDRQRNLHGANAIRLDVVEPAAA